MQPLKFGSFIGEPCRAFDLDDFRLTEVEDGGAMGVPRHSHENGHFTLILKGSYHTAARDADGPCPAGTVIFTPPGISHRDHFAPGGGRFCAVSLQAHRQQQMFAAMDGAGGPFAWTHGAPAWLAMRLYREWQTHDEASTLAIEALAIEMLAHTVRTARFASASPPAWLVRARTMIRDRCCTALTLSDIAAEVGVHRHHVARAFRKFLHCTPGDYLRHCRIASASQLLRHQTTPLAQVAVRTGYCDQSRFTKAFKAATGLTPAAFRSLYHGGSSETKRSQTD